jgi:hypothetical protein
VRPTASRGFFYDWSRGRPAHEAAIAAFLLLDVDFLFLFSYLVV